MAGRRASSRQQDAVERALAALGTRPQTLRIQLDSPSVAQSRRVAQNGSSLMGLRRSRSGCAFGYLGASGGPAVSQAAAPPSGLARCCFLSRAVHAQRISAVHPFNRDQVSCVSVSRSRLHVRSYLGTDCGRAALVPQLFPAAIFLPARRPSGRWPSYVSLGLTILRLRAIKTRCTPVRWPRPTCP